MSERDPPQEQEESAPGLSRMGEPGPDEASASRGRRVEQVLDPVFHLLRGAEERVLPPAWRRVTPGERRWPASVAILVAVALQVSLPLRLAPAPRWPLPTLEILLLAGIVAANPDRMNRRSRLLRVASMILIGLISVANAWSAGRLILGLIRGGEGQDAAGLLVTGGTIWLTNVIVFSLWYWELDRGGPAARAHALRPHPDFLFPQMQSPKLAPENWEPEFPDYLYLSFTTAAAFSPTDVLPLSRWAKLAMMLQSAVSLATLALVVARAVNVLR